MTTATPTDHRNSLATMDPPGREPADYGDLAESTGLLSAFGSPEKRWKSLGDPRTASKYRIDPRHVYTFEVYDEAMDFGNYYQHIMMGMTKIDLVNSLDGQSVCFPSFHLICGILVSLEYNSKLTASVCPLFDTCSPPSRSFRWECTNARDWAASSIFPFGTRGL